MIPMACKFGDYLPVLLDVRQVSQIVVPAELPDAAVLGATIDNRFRSTIGRHRNFSGVFSTAAQAKSQ